MDGLSAEMCIRDRCDAIEQRGRVAGIIENGPQHLTGHIGDRSLVTAVLIHRLIQQLPKRDGVELVIGRSDNLQPLLMGPGIAQEGPEAVAEEKADGETGGIGRCLLYTSRCV